MGECVSANEDVLLVKDGTDTLLTCCGTQCHAKTFKIAKDAADKTYEVTLKVRGKDKYPSRWLDPSGTLEKYKLLYKDVVRLQVSASAKTAAEEKKKKDDDAAAGEAAKKNQTTSSTGSRTMRQCPNHIWKSLPKLTF